MAKHKARGSEAARLPAGFRAAGCSAGIKRSGRPDMALIVSDAPAAAAGVFTTNQVQAAPVRLNRELLRGGMARAVVVNSGIANACTGSEGLMNARRMGACAAEHLGVPASSVFVCSTGSIGPQLPMGRIEKGIITLVPAAKAAGGEDAARAIMTTDTRPKRWSVRTRLGGRMVTVCGLAKGAGMIEPNMATMLAFLTTDAVVAPPVLQRLLGEAVDETFNRITVDGDRSTNDTVLFLANGLAGNGPHGPRTPGWDRFRAAVFETCDRLARMIVADGEGATKFITIHVRGARTKAEADLAARAVANSLLVKTAWAGSRANWGRVMDALGYSKARVREEAVDIRFDRLTAVRRGCAGPASEEALSRVVDRPSFTVDIHLHQGAGEATVYTCNCTEEYVRVNR